MAMRKYSSSNPLICHITTVHPRFDTRIFFKECISLHNAGFSVILLVNDGKNNEINSGITIKSIQERTGNKYKRIFLAPWKMLFAVLRERVRIVHFHDPELLLLGVLLRLCGKIVIYDAHENVPSTILYKKWIRLTFVRYLLAGAAMMIEKTSSLFFNRIICATKTIAKHFSSNKTEILYNYPVLSKITPSVLPKNISDKLIVIYAGALSNIRGIREVIRAINELSFDCEFWLVGSWVQESYKQICEAEPGWRNVRYFGQCSLEKTYEYIANANVGMICHYPVKNYLDGIPTKAFEYMACSLPIIVSDFPLMREYFTDCAVFVNPYSIDEIKAALVQLYSDTAFSQSLGKSGYEKVNRFFSWENEEKKLAALYNSLV